MSPGRASAASTICEVVGLRLGGAHPRLHPGPAAAVHLVAGLLQRPRHEARAPRVAGADAGRRQVLVDLLAGVDALLLDALGQLALGDLQRRGAEAARAARGRRGGVGHHGGRAWRPARPRSPGPAGGFMKDSSSPCLARGGLGGVLGRHRAEAQRVARLRLRLRERRPRRRAGRARRRGRGGGGGAEAACPSRPLASSSLSW